MRFAKFWSHKSFKIKQIKSCQSLNQVNLGRNSVCGKEIANFTAFFVPPFSLSVFMKHATLALFTCLLFFACPPAMAQKNATPKTDYLVSIHTEYGKIYLILFDDAPVHKQNFLKHTKARAYDSTTFHFVLENFMILGGDLNTKPQGDSTRIGLGAPAAQLPAEISKTRKHHRGSLGAARQKDEINPEKKSSGSHFYIVQNTEGAPHLDGQYTLFGEVIYGMEVVDKIASVEVDDRGSPVEPVYVRIRAEEMKRKKITKLFGHTFPTP